MKIAEAAYHELPIKYMLAAVAVYCLFKLGTMGFKKWLR
jgi:hypothetical protein